MNIRMIFCHSYNQASVYEFNPFAFVFVLALCVLSCTDHSIAQTNELFASSEPIVIETNTSMKATKKAAKDSTYTTKSVRYKEGDTWHTLEVGRKGRGNFRLANCYFPPLKIKLKSKAIKGTVFEGNKRLKLVTPCNRTPDMNELILKEYLIYKMYQEISPIHFKARLVTLKLTDTTYRKPKEFSLLGFLVEDNDLVAAREGGVIKKGLKLHPRVLADYPAVRHDFFQYMIGNADWSTVNDHNENTIFVTPSTYYPLPYDFDMAGFVNASYARENAPNLGTGNIRERVYRGFCRPPEVMDSVRREFLAKEQLMYDLIDRFQTELGDYQTKDMKSYLRQFFDILRADASYNRAIADACRTNQ